MGVLLLAMLASDGGTALGRTSPDFDAVDRYIGRQMAANRVPGLALAITRGDEVIYLKGYGTAGDGDPMTPDTQLYVASLSKGFTALAVMQLVEEGKIGLDEPVRAYLSDFTTNDRRLSDQITVRELLNQTSGLSDAGFPAYTLPQPEAQPGWRDVLIRRQYLPRIESVSALPTAKDGGFAGRPDPRVPGIPDLYLAGDWVGPEGFLVDASMASAQRAAQLVLEDGLHSRRKVAASSAR